LLASRIAQAALLTAEFTGASPGPPKLPGISHPTIQRVSLPAYTSDPNTLITTHAMRLLGLRPIPVGWLIQAPAPLTAAQVTAADHLAAAVGLTVETRSEPGHASLSSVSSRATAVGVLLALGVLAMTIGLIRSETASDLRILTAAGASSMTRRALTGGTAGALALLGALLGTAGAYLAMLAWQRSARILTHVPFLSLTVIIVGLPLVATAGGWLLAGREPAVIARRPLD
jgi:putative ABC transport system permease protein